MSKSVKFEVSGFDDISENLRSLPAIFGESALRRAVVAGGRLIRDEAKLRAPEKKGVLKNSIILKHIAEASDGANHQTYYVTVRQGTWIEDGKKDRSQDAFYWRFVEFGTSKSAAHPFMRPAFDGLILKAFDAMRASLADSWYEALADMHS